MGESDMWKEMRKHLQEMREAMDGAMRKVPPLRNLVPPEYPLVNVYESPDEILVRAEVAGLGRDDVRLTLHPGLLVIEGTKILPSPSGFETSLEEQVAGDFRREIPLPSSVDEDAAPTASLQAGVLNVRLRKQHEDMGRAIEVEVL